jgi:CheY-like chemotaxis protein
MLLPEKPHPVLTKPHAAVMESAADDHLSPLTMRTTEMANLMKRPKVLLVDNDENDRLLTRRSLETQNCEVVLATSVTDALRQIAAQRFDVLITDLHMPDSGDGFAVVTAMRHSQPNALTLVVSDFPDVQKAMNAILLQPDEVLVKPFDAKQLAGLMDKRKLTSLPSPRPAKEGAASILERDAPILIERWLERVEGAEALVTG